MNNIEEKLWEYIDGTCSEGDKKTIAALIKQNETWRQAYNDLLQMQSEIFALTPDEPPMALTYNVMEAIRSEEAAKPLKTTVSKYVIATLVSFFALSIIGSLIFVLKGDILNINTPMPYLATFTNAAVLRIFLYCDVLLVLFLADTIIRKRRYTSGVKSV